MPRPKDMTSKQQFALTHYVISRYCGSYDHLNLDWDYEWDCLVAHEMALIQKDLDDPIYDSAGLLVTRKGRLD